MCENACCAGYKILYLLIDLLVGEFGESNFILLSVTVYHKVKT